MIQSNKITPSHLNRSAYVYVRQSSQAQVDHHQESQRYQRQLAARAQAFGWQQPIVLTQDLGVSAGGHQHRADFERLTDAVCREEAGIIFSFDVSRLARNNRDWARLLEFCCVTHTLLADAQSIYDPAKDTDDKLILGLKGTLSEVELESIKARLLQARQHMARRGDLILQAAIGYVRSGKYRIRKNPDKRVQQAIELLFAKFFELRSIHQVYHWSQVNAVAFPHTVREHGELCVEWKLPTYAYFRTILHNPCYAGAYAFGKTGSKVVLIDGRKRIRTGIKKPMDEWDSLIHDHHAAYITWRRYEEILSILQSNHYSNDSGAAKEGHALLSGLLRCGHCYQSLSVRYNGKGKSASYFCRGKELVANGCVRCNAMLLDHAAEVKVLKVISPCSVEATLRAAEVLEKRRDQHREQIALALEEARYQSQRAHRQFDKVDPENRLVASELERGWNEALKEEQQCQSKLETFDVANEELTKQERSALAGLGQQLGDVWKSEQASPALKKEVMRAVLDQIIVKCEGDGELSVILHWKGGDHSKLRVPSRLVQQTDVESKEIIRQLSGVLQDEEIARLLTRNEKRTATGLEWTKTRVRTVRGKMEGEMGAHASIAEAAKELGVSEREVQDLITQGTLPAKRACKWAPQTINRNNLLKTKRIQQTLATSKRTQLNLL